MNKTKKKKWVIVISSVILGLLIIFGGIYGGFKYFEHKQMEVSMEEKNRQITFLQEHENEWINDIEKQNSKITSVQFDWSSVNVDKIGNGLPQGGGWLLTLDGRFNNIKDSSFTLAFELKNQSALPDGTYYIQQDFRIDGGTKIYE